MASITTETCSDIGQIKKKFVHLHLHTTYSLLDGAQLIGDVKNPKKEFGLLNKLQSLGMDAVAITDHGNMFGAIDFFKKATSAGIKPIMGCETYLAPVSRLSKEKGRFTDRIYYHQLILARNNTGYRNLSKLVTSGFFEGFHYRPRIDKEILRQHAEGLIGTSSCLAGEVCQLLLKGRDEEALAAAKEYAQIFNGYYYIELQMNGIAEQMAVNPKLVQIARELGLGLVATNDVHYMAREDAEAQDALLAIQTGKTISDPNRLKHDVQEFYLKSPDEMWELFKEWPDACENTIKIAEMCDVNLKTKDYYFPKLDKGDGVSNMDALRADSLKGLEARLKVVLAQNPPEKHDDLRKEYFDRLEYELQMIQKMGFADYFLIVSDFINWAKDHDIPVGPGRGSAAGSLVAFCTRITDIDPIKHSLLFERFLNPERVSMPDIDVDFCESRRDEVIQYVRERYAVPGGPAVSQIITFGKLKAKAVLKDVGRAMDISFNETNRLAKLIPNVLDITLDDALQQEPRLREEIKENPRLAKLFDIARRLEGLNRHASVHAAGVVISDGRPLVEHLPLYKGAKGEVVTQFDMKGVESVGLIKFDFLGLKNLTLIKNCLDLIKQNRGVTVDMETINIEDPAVFDLLCHADTLGVFQLESSGMRQLITRLRPSCFEDVIALVALYRPGPLQSGMADSFILRKHGQEKIDYIFDVLQPVLGSTYGVCIYQEQVMQIANVLASYSLGEADILRRAMGKKDALEMEKQRSRFVEGAQKNGFDTAKAEDLFGKVEKFAAYGFNRCLAGDTEILDAQTGERTTLAELHATPRPFSIHALGNDWKIHTRSVSDVIDNGIQPTIELKTALGKTITATANHPFRTLQGWTLLENLQVGTRIAAPRCIPTHTSNSWAEHQLIALAGLIAEGNTCHPTTLYFYNNNPIQIDDFAQAIQKFPNTVAHIYTRPNTVRMEVAANTGRAFRCTSQNQPTLGNLAQKQTQPKRSGAFYWAQQLGLIGCTATEKFVPSEIFTLRDDDIALFLGRLWAGDGFIFGRREHDAPFYATSSQRLAKDVQLLLLRLGLPSKIASKTFAYRGQKKGGFTVSLIGAQTKRRFVETVAPHCVGREEQVKQLKNYLDRLVEEESSKDTIPSDIRESIEDLRQKAGLTWKEVENRSGVCVRDFYGATTQKKKGFRRTTIQKLATFFSSTHLQYLGDSEIYWDTVVSITPKGAQRTYDLTVEHDHNFVANGLIVHNSHSAAYGLVAYQTAWLKAHYRHEYMAALLTADAGNSDKLLLYLNDCRQHKVQVLPPNVNESHGGFVAIGDRIRFGLAGIKGIGENAIDAIIQARRSGQFTGIYDFCERVDLKPVNKRVIEALIKSGAFDGIEPINRASLVAVMDDAVQYGQSLQKDKGSNQISMFDILASSAPPPKPKIPLLKDWPEKERLQQEKEILGFYISGHPLQRLEKDLKRFVTANIADLSDYPSGSEVTIAGIITSKRGMVTKKGDPMAFIMVEDMTGTIEVSVFPRLYSEVASLLDSDEPVLVRGETESDENQVRMKGAELRSLIAARNEKAREVHLHLTSADLSEAAARQMLQILHQHQGSCLALLHLTIPQRSETLIRLPEHIRVDPSESFEEAIENLFGPRALSLR